MWELSFKIFFFTCLWLCYLESSTNLGLYKRWFVNNISIFSLFLSMHPECVNILSKWIWVSFLNWVNILVKALIQMMLLMDYSGVGVTKPISSVPLFLQFFRLIKILFTFGISRSCLADIDAAELWWHLLNMDVIWRIHLYFCQIKNFTNREINKWSFSNPHAWSPEHCTQQLTAHAYEWG